MSGIYVVARDAILISHDLNNFCWQNRIARVQLRVKRHPKARKLVELFWDCPNDWDDGAVRGFICAWITATHERRARYVGDKVSKSRVRAKSKSTSASGSWFAGIYRPNIADPVPN